MTTFVLVCGDGSVPESLSGRPFARAAAVPTNDEIDGALPDAGRIVVCGSDAALAAVLTRLMRTERLDLELAYVSAEKTAATQSYKLPTGARAVRLAFNGAALATPLVRDDAGVALVGAATLTGPDGVPITGETYVDEHRLYSGTVPFVEIRTTAAMPGLRARAGRGWRARWLPGRAAQSGATGIALTRDGVPAPRTLKRSTFYRHTTDWLLVR